VPRRGVLRAAPVGTGHLGRIRADQSWYLRQALAFVASIGAPFQEVDLHFYSGSLFCTSLLEEQKKAAKTLKKNSNLTLR
jgi:hypothetical protein